MTSTKSGIDVSTWQGDIDFAKIDKSKVEFVLCRASFGWEKNQKDNRFDRNIKGFQGLNIPCGAYHYAYATNVEEALKEADYFLSCIKGYKLELPVYYDMEENSIAALGRETCTAIAKVFCEKLKSEGYLVGIYTNPNWLKNYLDYEQLKDYELWLASWGASKPSYSCGIWQHNVGKNGFIAGINGEVDLNYMYTDYPALIKKVGYNGFTSTHTGETTPKPATPSASSLKAGDRVTVTKPVIYGTNDPFTVYDNAKYTIMELKNDRAVIGIDNQVTAAVNIKHLKKYGERTIKYTVQNGDTLSAIAARYNTTVVQIVLDNKIQNPDLIYGGQILTIKV